MNYTIIGAAKSGTAAALLARETGHNVFLTESKPVEGFEDTKDQLDRAGVESEFGGNTARALANADIVITSPGVPPKSSIIIEAEKKGIPIISELEFAWRQMNNPFIAITGTNGKTTTTSLTAFIIQKSGRKAVTAGNIGTPLSSLVGRVSPDTIIVAEVSSFQLDRTEKFRPDVAVILNITPDHLYYHGTMEKYTEAKWKISANQIEKDLVILNADDALTMSGMQTTRGKVACFSKSPTDFGIFTAGERLLMRFPDKHKEEELMLLKELSLPGMHNAYNSMAAALAARAFEIRNEDIRDSLMAFQGVEHRLEYVRTIDEVDFINDSKATNVNATWYALSSYRNPLVWIAGGRGDSNDYSQLDDLVRRNVKCIVAIGEEADAIFNHFSGMVRCVKEDSMEGAVQAAKDFSEAGDIVLFTPACKSFDWFVNYEHRGEVFKEIVNNL